MVKRSIKLHLHPYQVKESLKNYMNSIMFLKRAQKNKRKRNSDGPWKKISIFFELLYWPQNRLRHNLDPMHIEKNFCNSLLCTLLDIAEKSKDHVNCRYNLHQMGICKEIQPIEDDNNGKVHLANACFSMKPEEKRLSFFLLP